MIGEKRHCLKELLSVASKKRWPARSCHFTGEERHLLKVPDLSPLLCSSWCHFLLFLDVGTFNPQFPHRTLLTKERP